MVSHALRGKSPFGVMTAAVRRNTMRLPDSPLDPPGTAAPVLCGNRWRALTF